MHLFSDYFQPLTYWLYTHPNAALFFTFIMAWAESLAVVGSIVPGSITMTSVGILAGSGIMRIDLTFLAATLGAIVGDSTSYFLGYLFSDRLTNMWPFKKHPSWLKMGQDYFEQHGGKSVLLGRFIGPLRSIIPVIAGMLRMKQWHFLFANVLSGIGWAILYVTPGVLIGAASTELTAEGATRLFVFILLLLVLIWLVTRITHWLLTKLGDWLQPKCRVAWETASNWRYGGKIIRTLTPSQERDHATTIWWLFSAVLCSTITILILGLIMFNTWVSDINTPIYLFLQSLRTQIFDMSFMLIGLLISPYALLTLTLAMVLLTAWKRQWRLLRYWLSVGFVAVTVILLLSIALDDIPQPSTLLYTKQTAPLLPINITIATTLFGFLLVYLRANYKNSLSFGLQMMLLGIIILSGMAKIYLGDCWIASVFAAYFIGVTLCVWAWLFYRRKPSAPALPLSGVTLVCLSLVLAATVAYQFSFKKITQRYYLHYPQFVLTEKAWWHQAQPSIMPLYINNRIGQPVGIFNIQYSGPLDALEAVFEKQGWKKQRSSFFYALMQRAGGEGTSKALPLISQLYLNQKPSLIMLHEVSPKTVLVLRLWRSNFHLEHAEPLWIGSINTHTLGPKPPKEFAPHYDRFIIDAGTLQLPTSFHTKRIDLRHPPKKGLHIWLIHHEQD